MSTFKPERADHIKAGAFVVVAILIFAVLFIALAGGSRLWRRTTSYLVRFSLDSGATGLTDGSDVRVGGRSVGSVSRIDLAYDDPGRPPVGVDVRISIERSIPVYGDAVAFLERPLFGSSSVINFPSLGGSDGAKRLDEHDSIPGLIAPPELLRNAGFGADQSEQLKGVLQRLDDLTVRILDLSDTFQKDIIPSVKVWSGDLQKLTADVRERSGIWFDRADTFTDNLTAISDEAHSGVEDARRLIGQLNDLVEKNSDHVNTTVAQFQSASGKANTLLDKLNDQSISLLNDLLTDGERRLDEAGDVVEQISTLVGEQKPEIRVTIGNLRQASEQLKMTMGEIRRSPWRLLHRPKAHEVEFQYLYDSARSYASAVSDLRAASESLESVLGSDGSRLATEGQTLTGYVDDISRAFDQYKKAEATFLDTLMAQGGPRGHDASPKPKAPATDGSP